MNHPFQFCLTKSDFHRAYHELLLSLIGKKVLRLYGVWDLIYNEWFEDAPMILEFEHGELAVITLSNAKIALMWNEIIHTEKPIWYDIPPEELDWEEDLVWKEYYDLSEGIVKQFEIIHADSSIIGLLVTTDKNKFGIVDNGDVTIGVKDNSLSWYLNEEKNHGFILSNALVL